MSLQPESIGLIPEETTRVAKAAFPKGNIYLRLRDEFGTLYHDTDFAQLFSTRGQPALPPWRLALVTVIQFLENLSDRQAANAVRARIDIKYLLGLELTDPGFHYSVLSEFRTRLIAGNAEQLLLERMLEHFKTKGLLGKAKQRTDSTHVLASIRVLNRLELVGETLRATLNELAREAPEWLRSVAQPGWFERYGERIEDSRLPKGKAAKRRYAQQVGEDGYAVLDALDAADTMADLGSLQTVKALRLVWARHYVRQEGRVRFKDPPELSPAAQGVQSPYDLDARYSTKAGMEWVGYKVHITETCDDDEVHLITDVTTTQAMVQDVSCTERIQRSLLARGLAPSEHLVDAGYVDADLLVSSQRRGISLIGPTRKDKSWQRLTEGAYDQDHFTIDWENKQVWCPNGKRSSKWTPQRNAAGEPYIIVFFRQRDCSPCPSRSLCTRAKKSARGLKLHPQAEHEALRDAREYFASDEGRTEYRMRAGVEGTLSQGIRALGLRRARYRGLAKTGLQQVATASATNVSRAYAWLEGVPRERTRTSRFAALAA